MEIGAIIILPLIVLALSASELWDRAKRHQSYIRELECTVERQERSLKHYRFMRLQKEMTAGVGTPNGQRTENVQGHYNLGERKCQ